MGDDRTAALPDGTDTVIEGAAKLDDGGIATVEDTTLDMMPIVNLGQAAMRKQATTCQASQSTDWMSLRFTRLLVKPLRAQDVVKVPA